MLTSWTVAVTTTCTRQCFATFLWRPLRTVDTRKCVAPNLRASASFDADVEMAHVSQPIALRRVDGCSAMALAVESSQRSFWV